MCWKNEPWLTSGMSAVETAGLRLRPIEKRSWPPVYWSTLSPDALTSQFKGDSEFFSCPFLSQVHHRYRVYLEGWGLVPTFAIRGTANEPLVLNLSKVAATFVQSTRRQIFLKTHPSSFLHHFATSSVWVKTEKNHNQPLSADLAHSLVGAFSWCPWSSSSYLCQRVWEGDERLRMAERILHAAFCGKIWYNRRPDNTYYLDICLYTLGEAT